MTQPKISFQSKTVVKKIHNLERLLPSLHVAHLRLLGCEIKNTIDMTQQFIRNRSKYKIVEEILHESFSLP
jgi:hypothetical protein